LVSDRIGWTARVQRSFDDADRENRGGPRWQTTTCEWRRPYLLVRFRLETTVVPARLDRVYRVAMYSPSWRLSPKLGSCAQVVRSALVALPHRLDRALCDLNTRLVHLAALSGLGGPA